MNIALLSLEQTLKSALFGIEELFYINNHFCKQDNEPFISTQIVTLDNLDNDKTYDIIIIPPQMGNENFNFNIPALTQWLVSQYNQGTILCSACVGSFFLAQAQLLNNKYATTHWAYAELFKSSFPEVKLNTDKILIDEHKIITAGGVTAYFDLCLYLVEKFHSNKTAMQLANLLVVDKSRSSQKSYKSFSTIFLFDDEAIKQSVNWMQKNYKEQISNALLAKQLNLTERTFTRRFKKALNTTPNHYLQNVRIEKAKELLITTHKSFDEITFDVGFFNESSFRKLFKRETSLNPKAFRNKFQQSL